MSVVPRSDVIRPPIPAVAWLACAAWLGCVCGEQAGWALAAGPVPAAAAWVAAFGVGCGCVLAHRVRRSARGTLALALAGVVAGVGVSGAQFAAWSRDRVAAADCGAREWTGWVEADPAQSAFGATVRVRLTGGPLDGARVKVHWPDGCAAPDLGRTVRFSAIVRPLSLDEPSTRRSARAAVVGNASAWRAEVGEWRPGVMGRLLSWRADALLRLHEVPGRGGDLLEGIVLGDRRRLAGTRTDEDFRVLGLTHLVAVSGSHLALACGAVAFVARAAGVARRPTVLGTLAAGAGYAVITGMPYSALRSLLMLAVGAAAVLAGRRGDGLATLGVSVLVVLTIEPWSVFDLGFQLSVLAVGSLLLFGGLATAWASCASPPVLRGVASAIGLTLVAQVVSAPVVVGAFSAFSTLAPLANAYAGPLVSVAMFLGLAGVIAGTLVPTLGTVLQRAAAAVLEVTAWVSHQLAGLPGAAVAVGGGVWLGAGVCMAAAAVWVTWPRPGSARHARTVGATAGLLSVALALGPAPARSPRIVVLDVGQGDAILVQDLGRTMLVDTGPDATSLRAALARHGVRRVDALVLTHSHDDHTGGAPGLPGVVALGWAGVPARGFTASLTGIEEVAGPSRPLAAGQGWHVGGWAVRVLWPPAEGPELDCNDTSVVLQLTHGEMDAVLTGDAEGAAQGGMCAAGALTPVEVLKVPHHGSSNGLTAEAVRLWKPGAAIVSVGHGNDFGHPSPAVIELLHGVEASVWRTDRCGDITVEVQRSGYTVTSRRRGGSTAVRERMEDAPPRHAARMMSRCADSRPKGFRGGQEHRRVETGLSDPWRSGAAARARAPPTPGARGGSGRPRLQPRLVRR